MALRLSQQEIMNAICLHMAERRRLQPTDIEVELSWDEQYGYSAEAFYEGRSQILVEANMLEAIDRYVFQEYEVRGFRSQIRLDIDDDAEEMIAIVES